MSEAVPYSHLEKGTFLIASPELTGNIFFRGVILLCEHSDQGSFGLLINKPLDVELPEEVLDLSKLENPNVELRTSGPLQTNQMMVLHNYNEIPDQTLEICKGVYLGGDLNFLQQAVTVSDGPAMRLCFGYTAWTAGQLEREFLDGHWFLCPAKAEHLFQTPAPKLWQTLLREMGGKYAALSMIPEDLSLN